MLCAVGAPTVRADDEVDRLREKFDKAKKAYYEKGRESGKYDRDSHPAVEFLPEFKKYIEAHKGESDAIPALDWVIRNAQSSGKREAYRETFRWALSWIKKYHAADPDIEKTVAGMRYIASYVDEEVLIDLYDEFLRKNPSDGVKAKAMFNKAFTLYRNRSSDDDEKAAARKTAKKLFRKVVADYPDESVTDRARGFVFEIDNLQIGMKAPEIVGKDVDGKEIRLSQFFGQVVVIDFWGFW